MGKVVSMTFRHNMSAILVSQSNLAMAEMEQYVTCHSKATQHRDYADQVTLEKICRLKTGTQQRFAWRICRS